VAITLADAGRNTQDDVDFGVIDETRRSSFLLDSITFDDTVTPGTAGGTMVAGYTRLTTTRAADTRQQNTEYPAREAVRTRVTVDLIPLGGRYNIDRVFANLGDAATNEVAFQQSQVTLATIAKFHDLFINGVAADFEAAVPEFNGLDAIVTGTSTESYATGTTPWDFDGITDKAGALAANRALRAWMREFYRTPDVLFVNRDGAAWLDSLNDWMSFNTTRPDEFGVEMPTWNGIPYVDLGDKADGATEIIGTTGAGVTSIYAACLGLDSVHAYTVAGSQVLRAWLPDFSTAGAVKSGEVEMSPVAIAAKRTKGVGAFRVDVI